MDVSNADGKLFFQVVRFLAGLSDTYLSRRGYASERFSQQERYAVVLEEIKVQFPSIHPLLLLRRIREAERKATLPCNLLGAPDTCFCALTGEMFGGYGPAPEMSFLQSMEPWVRECVFWNPETYALYGEIHHQRAESTRKSADFWKEYRRKHRARVQRDVSEPGTRYALSSDARRQIYRRLEAWTHPTTRRFTSYRAREDLFAKGSNTATYISEVLRDIGYKG